MEKLYEIHASMTSSYIFRAVGKNLVWSNSGRSLTYLELGYFEFNNFNRYSKPKEATISNCPLRIVEYVED